MEQKINNELMMKVDKSASIAENLLLCVAFMDCQTRTANERKQFAKCQIIIHCQHIKILFE